MATGVVDALAELLAAQSSISAIAGARIEALRLPSSGALPALTLRKVSETPGAPSHDGAGPARSRIEVNAWSLDYRTAVSLDLAVLAFLCPSAVPNAPEPVRRHVSLGLELQAEIETQAREFYETDTQMCRCSRDYFIWSVATS